LSVGLCPDPLRELTALPQTCQLDCRSVQWTELEEGRGKKGEGWQRSDEGIRKRGRGGKGKKGKPSVYTP